MVSDLTADNGHTFPPVLLNHFGQVAENSAKISPRGQKKYKLLNKNCKKITQIGLEKNLIQVRTLKVVSGHYRTIISKLPKKQ